MSFDGEGGDRTVFVGGVSIKATEEGLKQFFESNFGDVESSKIIYDRTTGRSKGYGFVTFTTPETADRVRQSSGLMFLGKVLNIGNAFRRHPTYAPRDDYGGGAVAPGGQYGGGYGGGYSAAPYYPPYYPPYMWPPIPPPAAENGGVAASPEQLQAYQAQVQAALQAQMAMWAQMQQNPAAMQQFAAQFQAMSLGNPQGLSPPPPQQVPYGESKSEDKKDGEKPSNGDKIDKTEQSESKNE